MKEIDSLKVMCHGRLVGRLTIGTNSTCLFQYGREWLNTGFSISPLKLPLKADLFEADYLPFHGNFGVFEDSLPGGYGEYVLQKELEKRGVNYMVLNPLQRLSIVGSSGMGALCYVPDNKITMPSESVNLDEVQQAALDVLSGKTDENAGRLYVDSGNSGGVRPKILLQDGGRNWMVKFRHTYDPIASGVIELMYNPLLALTGYLTQDHIEVEQQFRRMVFNYYAENFDDHARNFSFLYIDGRWQLSPAYDMTHDSPLGQHATTVGFKANPTEEDFIEVGKSVRMSKKLCSDIIDEVKPRATSDVPWN